MAPQTLDQSEGDKVCGPDRNCDTKNNDKGIVGLLQKISSQQVSAPSQNRSHAESRGNMP